MGKKVKGTACVNCVYYNATGISMPKEDESEGYCLDACHNKNNKIGRASCRERV